MAGDVTHTILAVEDRGLRLPVEGTTITLVVAEAHTTRTGSTVAAEEQGALKLIALHHPQEDMRKIGTDSMLTMEGGVEIAMAIGKSIDLSLPSA